MKKLFALILTLAVMLSITACSGDKTTDASPDSSTNNTESADGPIVLKFGHSVDENSHWHLGLLRFKELIEERTDGRYVIDVYANSQLGGERDQIESVLMNAQDGGVFAATVVSNTAPFLGAFDLPYIIRDQEHIEKILTGDLGKEIASELDKYGFKCLTVWAGGFRCISNNTRPINSAADISGMKIRTQEGRVHSSVWKALGANAVSMSWVDAYTSVQQGAVDGVEVNLSLTNSLKVYEICDYLAISNEQYTMAPMLMSLSAWNKISPEDQQIFLDTAAEVTAYEIDIAKQLDEEALSILDEHMEITYPDIDELTELAKPVWDEFDDLTEWVDRINNVQ